MRFHHDLRERPTGGGRYSSVTQPSLAVLTFLMYLYSVPRVAFSGGALQDPLSLGEFCFAEIDVQSIGFGIDRHRVAILQQSKRAAVLCFGSDVANDEPVAAAAETAVGQHGHIAAESGAHDGTGRCQHLRHAGSTFGSFVANHDDVPFLNFLFLQRVKHVFFAVEAACRTGELQPFFASDLGDRTVRGERAAQDANVTA